MTFLDWILIFIFIAFIASGFKGGFIYSFGSFLGVLIGALVAGKLYDPLAKLIAPDANWAKVLMFLIIFLLVNQIIGVVFYIINKVANLIMIIPFLGVINRLGGVIFGFIEGMLFLGISVFFLTRFEWADKIIEILGDSRLVPILSRIGKSLSFLLPEIIRHLNSVI